MQGLTFHRESPSLSLFLFPSLLCVHGKVVCTYAREGRKRGNRCVDGASNNRRSARVPTIRFPYIHIYTHLFLETQRPVGNDHYRPSRFISSHFLVAIKKISRRRCFNFSTIFRHSVSGPYGHARDGVR